MTAPGFEPLEIYPGVQWPSSLPGAIAPETVLPIRVRKLFNERIKAADRIFRPQQMAGIRKIYSLANS
jgi:hypothetical protein